MSAKGVRNSRITRPLMHDARSAVEELKHNGSRYSIIARKSSLAKPGRFTAAVDAASETNRKELTQVDARDIDSSGESSIDRKHVVMCSLIRPGSPSSTRPSTTRFLSVKGEWMYPGRPLRNVSI